MRDLIPETAVEALARWDKNESVFTIEMGGLGPSYEQCIHILVFEMIRDHRDTPIPPKESEGYEAFVDKFGEEAITRCDALVGGFSGAQVGAARTIAFRALRDGWRKTIDSAPQDRRIHVSRTIPTAPPIVS